MNASKRTVRRLSHKLVMQEYAAIGYAKLSHEENAQLLKDLEALAIAGLTLVAHLPKIQQPQAAYRAIMDGECDEVMAEWYDKGVRIDAQTRMVAARQ